MKILYCPKCGASYNESAFSLYNEEGKLYCFECHEHVKLQYTLHDEEYYQQKIKEQNPDIDLFRLLGETNKLIDEEIHANPEFDFEKWNNRESSWLQYSEPDKPNVPKCPTCGSTDVIKEHSNASVILSRTFFGPYSSSSWSQFRCNNCGYMW